MTPDGSAQLRRQLNTNASDLARLTCRGRTIRRHFAMFGSCVVAISCRGPAGLPSQPLCFTAPPLPTYFRTPLPTAASRSRRQ